jgi:hypothetical protein
MANIAWEKQRALNLNTETAEFINDPEATKMRGRAYEKGWEPHV